MRVLEGVDEGPERKRVIIAFSVEINSGIDSGGLAERDRVRLLADRISFLCHGHAASNR